MSKQQPRPAVADQDPGATGAGSATLDALLAEREALCAQLSARQLEFAALVKEQAGEIARLTAALADSRGSLDERYGEIARLSKLVLELEDSVAARTAELATAASAAREREAARSSEVAALQGRLDALQHDHASALERERVLAEHGSAVRSAELAAARAAAARQQALVAGARATVQQARASRAWRTGRFLFRERDLELPADDADAFDHLGYQQQVIARSDLFDPDWYLATYPEVADSGLDPAEHYLRLGALAGYDPSPRFDTVGYLQRYRDVRVSGMNPLVHYLEHGRAESRDPGRATAGAAPGTAGTPCS